MAASPSSSPRLPSPPPMAEDQLGPKSPIAMPNEHGQPQQNPFEANASRRIRPGTKAADMALGPPLVPLTDIDSPFQLTEHLKSLHNAALHRDGSSTVSPIDRETATRLAQPPDGVDKYLWLYELCRLLCKEINAMIVALFQDDPPCSAQTCSEMRASEWQYLCAVHDPPKPCCAIDYCCHTLDWTNHVLTSQKNFPSRLSVGADSGSGHQQLRQLTNIFRRVYRIFAHAWFQHRDMYWRVELKSGLYVFFKTVCDAYNLIPEDNYTVPPEAEGIEPEVAPGQTIPSILRRSQDPGEGSQASTEEDTAALRPSSGHPTQRHRHTPSVGSESITTVLEEPEEGDDKAGNIDETVILDPEGSENVSEDFSKESEEDVVNIDSKKVDTHDMTAKQETEHLSDEESKSLEEEKSDDKDGRVGVKSDDVVPETETNEEDVKTALPAGEEAKEPATTEVPTIAVESAADSSTEVHDSAFAGEKAESTTSNDSDSSWQVLTDDSQSSSSTAQGEEKPSDESDSSKQQVREAAVAGKEVEQSHREPVLESDTPETTVQILGTDGEPKEEEGVEKKETLVEKKGEEQAEEGNMSLQQSMKKDHHDDSRQSTVSDPKADAKDTEEATKSVGD